MAFRRVSLGLLFVLMTVWMSTSAQTTPAVQSLGGSCSESQPCTEQNNICFNNTCALKAGEDCTNNPNSCVKGSTCKTNQCTCNDNLVQYWTGLCVPFIGLGGACSRFDVCHNQPDPTVNLACVNNKCLIQVNQTCADNNKCVTGATCTNGLCKCSQGYFDYSKDEVAKCRRHASIGEDCSDGASCEDDPNGPDITCDRYKFTCVIKEDKACNSSNQMFCPTGATCQNSKCACVEPTYHHDKGGCSKVISTVGGACGKNDLCRNDALGKGSMDCDRFSGRCALRVTQSCQKYPDGCVTGAVCSNTTNTCVCSGTYTTSESGSSCQGPQGQIGGQCNTGNTCSDTSTTCNDGYCLCKTGYQFIATNSSCVAGGSSGNGNHGNHGGNPGGTGSSVAPGMLSVAVFLLSSLLH